MDTKAQLEGCKYRDDVSVKALPGLGLAVGFAALIGASCCVLPLVLAMAGASGTVIGNLAPFVAYRTYITATAACIIVLGWLIALKRKAKTRAYVVLGVATTLVVSAFAVTVYEPQITRYLLMLRQAS